MGLADDVVTNLRGFSKAMFSTWFQYKPARLLLDAGEGVSSSMENFIFGIESILLSHGHYDHIGGIGGIIHSRASARGDKEKPLRIYYPADDAMIELLHEYTLRISNNVKYELDWVPVHAGDEFALGTERDRGLIRAFPVEHSARTVNLGYQLFERRTRLKPELAELAQDEIEQRAKEHGPDSVVDEYEQIVLAYCGDSAPVDPDLVRGAEVLLHEATFIDPGDRENEIHSTVAEALDVARQADVSRLVLIHISTRYPKRRMAPMIGKIATDCGFDRPLTMVMGRRFTDLLGPGGEPAEHRGRGRRR
ncbi:MAG: MBL fold metallo-hydrolase [Planctomycetota bacterium]